MTEQNLNNLDQQIAAAVAVAVAAGVPTQAVVGYLEVWCAHIRTRILMDVDTAVCGKRDDYLRALEKWRDETVENCSVANDPPRFQDFVQ